MVSIAELELHDVTDSGDDGIGDECVLRATDDDRDDLVGAAVGFESRQGGGCGGDGEENGEGLHSDKLGR